MKKVSSYEYGKNLSHLYNYLDLDIDMNSIVDSEDQHLKILQLVHRDVLSLILSYNYIELLDNNIETHKEILKAFSYVYTEAENVKFNIDEIIDAYYE